MQAWIETFLTIESERGAVVPFKLYPQQVRMLEDHTGRDITVKGRQTRASSLLLARNLRRMTTSFGLKCLVITQNDQATQMFRARILHHIEDLNRAGLNYPIVEDNKNGIVIGKDMGNRYVFASAEERVTGRSYSAHIVHASEVAHWKPENAGALIGSIVPAVPGPPTGWFDMESTPNGAEGVFYEYAQDALSDDPLQGWALHFYPWWLEPRYKGGTEEDCDLRLDRETFEDLVRTFSPSHRETFLMEQDALSIEQILWRRWRERELNRTGVPFLQEYVEDIQSCFITGSENYFASPDGADHLAMYRAECRDPIARVDALPYRGADISFFGQNLSVWEYPHPGDTYVVFCDLAEGGTGTDHDFSAACVVNAMTRHHAATLRIKCAPSDFGAMVCALGQYYNQAWVAGERGNYGSAALDRIRALSYPKVYYHVDYGPTNKKPDAWIFPTQQHRDELLRCLREAVFDHSFATRDRIALAEMGTFDWQKVSAQKAGYKAKARRRRNDDLVIALAGALYVAQRIYRAPRARRPDEPENVVVGRHGVVIQRGNKARRPVFR